MHTRNELFPTQSQKLYNGATKYMTGGHNIQLIAWA